MTAKSVLMRPQGLRPGTRAPILRHCTQVHCIQLIGFLYTVVNAFQFPVFSYLSQLYVYEHKIYNVTFSHFTANRKIFSFKLRDIFIEVLTYSQSVIYEYFLRS